MQTGIVRNGDLSRERQVIFICNFYVTITVVIENHFTKTMGCTVEDLIEK